MNNELKNTIAKINNIKYIIQLMTEDIETNDDEDTINMIITSKEKAYNYIKKYANNILNDVINTLKDIQNQGL